MHAACGYTFFLEVRQHTPNFRLAASSRPLWRAAFFFVPSTTSNSPTLPRRRLRDWLGYVIVAAYGAVVATSLWLRHEYVRDSAHATARVEDWGEVIRDSARVLHSITEIYAAGMEPPTSGELRGLRVVDAQVAFHEEVKGLRARLDRQTDVTERAQLEGKIEPMAQAADQLCSEAQEIYVSGRAAAQLLAPDPPVTKKGIRRLEGNHRAAVGAHAQLREQLHSLARDRQKRQAACASRVERLDFAMHGLLLATIAATTFFLYRLARQVRSDVQEKSRLVEESRSSNAKYRSIFDNAIEGIFQTTPDGRFITANPALARMYGYDSPEHLMRSLSDVGTQLYVDRGQRDALLRALREEDVVSNFEFEVVRADGRMMWLRENVRAVRGAQGQLLYLEGTVEDVSESWWSEQRRRLQYATTRVLGESATMAEARPKILQTICEILEWDMGTVWDVDKGAMLLRCVEILQTSELDIAELEEANARTAYPRGDGLAGQVWQSGEPKWIANLAEEGDFPNADIAVKCGMGSAFGVPIMVAGEVLHVLEFFSPKIALPDPELLQTLGAIGSQLGHLVERKEAEEALRKSEMRKAAILNSALDCIISFDLDGRITEFNPAAERAFGYSQAEAHGRDMAELIIPEALRESHRRGIAIYNASTPTLLGLGQRMEFTAMKSDGSEFPIELSISRITIDGKLMFTAYLRDITERRKAERITSELAAVVENSNDAIVACSLDGVIRSWNAGAERIYGYTAEEAVGQPLNILLPEDQGEGLPQTLTAVRRGESLADYETVRLRKNGKKICVSLTDSPIREAGTITGLSSIARDITERKRLEEELLQSQKMDAIGRLAGGIAHDFNNILTAILGYSDLLIGQIDERQWMYKHLAEIRKAADLAASLTHQLLAFSRRQPLYLRVFNINDTVRNLQKMLQRVIGEHIQIETRLDAESGRLKADPGQLEQVLLNLCVNARDAMPKGGSITIATADVTYFVDDFYAATELPAGEYVKLTVSDSGCGIPPEIIKHIFEPFFTTKDQGQGTGLGLATCYGIVKQSGGYIAVDSEVGKGTTLTVYLPRVEESGQKAPIRKEAGELPGGSETILYVEDEASVRSLTAHVLRKLGYTVLEAGDGKQARDVVEAQATRNIDLLLSDVVLPDAGGRELADWITARSSDTRILFTSGYVDETILRRHGLEPGSDLLQKPFSPAELANRVREVMDAAVSTVPA